MMRGALAAVLAVCVLWTAAAAQERDAAASSGSCSGIANLRDFTIRSARLNDPFWMLRWRRPGDDVRAAVAGLAGRRYSFDTVNEVSKLIESKNWLPDTGDALVSVAFSEIALERCEGQELDVVFTVFSAAVSPTITQLFEWRSHRKTANEMAGVSQPNAVVQVAPEISFDRARGTAAGGRAQLASANTRLPFSIADLSGFAATNAHNVLSSLRGQHDASHGFVRRAEWRAGFEDSSEPAGAAQVDQRRFGFQLIGASRPMRGVVARAGGGVDGGHDDSSFDPAALPADTVASTGVSGVSLFAGITGHPRHQAFAASYGLLLGSTGRSFHGDWRKHIVDIAHDVWVPFSNRRLFEFEQRLTFGRLQTVSAVPAAERFFGGTADADLLLMDSWHIRANPAIRSIPANGFARGGVGSDRFVAYTSTTAVTVWNKPIVPSELLRDDQFASNLNGALISARNVLDVVFQSRDPNFQAIVARLGDLTATLDRIAGAAAAGRAQRPSPERASAACSDAVASAQNAARRAATGKPAAAVGWVKEMLPGGDAALADVSSSCGADRDLDALATMIETRFNAIDVRGAATKAAGDMQYAERALAVITREMSVSSISPVLVFDVARLEPGPGVLYAGTRYGVGGGIRFTLASSVSATATYAANLGRQAGEARGALMFLVTTRNLFE